MLDYKYTAASNERLFWKILNIFVDNVVFLIFKKSFWFWSLLLPLQQLVNHHSHVQSESFLFVQMFLLLTIQLIFILSDAQHPDSITYSPFLPHYCSS